MSGLLILPDDISPAESIREMFDGSLNRSRGILSALHEGQVPLPLEQGDENRTRTVSLGTGLSRLV